MAGDQHLEEGWSANVQTLVALLLVVVIVGILVAAGYGDVITDRFVEADTPRASFEFSYDRDAGLLTVEHVGGESIPGRQVVVRSGNRTVGNFSAHETVTAGDEIVVEGVDRTTGAVVVWRRSDRTIVLARWPR